MNATQSFSNVTQLCLNEVMNEVGCWSSLLLNVLGFILIMTVAIQVSCEFQRSIPAPHCLKRS
jgi:hypothetical protein